VRVLSYRFSQKLISYSFCSFISYLDLSSFCASLSLDVFLSVISRLEWKKRISYCCPIHLKTLSLEQVEWMLDQVRPFVDAHRAKGIQRPLQVLDVGGGKGNLASAIAKRFGSDVQVFNGIIIFGECLLESTFQVYCNQKKTMYTWNESAVFTVGVFSITLR